MEILDGCRLDGRRRHLSHQAVPFAPFAISKATSQTSFATTGLSPRLIRSATIRGSIFDPKSSAPNALLFYLGQQHQAISPCIVYEYDFDRRGNESYQPSMIMD
ncbi:MULTISPECIES: SAVED domain-containing protein [unclassified Bradyrhizobium]|uniref:SAVED domain-containing protein n=1 Tax=unclassified Bradyrhizobium TaxID=2631580 RepID=UPI0029166EE6|nr:MULTISPECIES: SAVED domain-containing protein [unclassified Bradyrhizobium]